MSDAPEPRTAHKAADDEIDRDEVTRDEIDGDEVDDGREADDIDDDDTPAIQPSRPLIDRGSDRDAASDKAAPKPDD